MDTTTARCNRIDNLAHDAGAQVISQLLSRQAQVAGLLTPLVNATMRGPNWALLTHRDSENDPQARHFTEWLLTHLQADPT
ncbi:hypothetical protein AZH11_07540 [Pseudomonas simiae]|nr:hypothetical protein AZH11_07540 [Pseudomonas simiae]